jgi:MFS family permease
MLNLSTGLLVNKIPAVWLLSVTAVLSAVSALLMALVQPEWPYWYNSFFSQLLMPVHVDVLFTVGLIIVADTFPERMQATAGAVFSTVSQIGQAFGLAIMQVISELVTQDSKGVGNTVQNSLMSGYRASFFTMFGWMIVCFMLGVYGLRKAGMVGKKSD